MFVVVRYLHCFNSTNKVLLRLYKQRPGKLVCRPHCSEFFLNGFLPGLHGQLKLLTYPKRTGVTIFASDHATGNDSEQNSEA